MLADLRFTTADEILLELCELLQIKPDQHKAAESAYLEVGHWLSAPESPLMAFDPQIYPQGSLRIGTTNQPIARQEYDLDLVCELAIDWKQLESPSILLADVESRIALHPSYRNVMERRPRCIRLRFGGRFHLDIVPACPDPGAGETGIVIPDRELRSWRSSNPKGFADGTRSVPIFFSRVFEKEWKNCPYP